MMKDCITESQLEIKFEDDMIFQGDAISYIISDDGRLYFNVEQCARAIGQTETSKKGSTTVRWRRVYNDLVKIEQIADGGDYKDLSKEEKSDFRKLAKSMLIEEKDFYLWSFQADTDKSKEFRNWLAEKVLPNLREHGIYMEGMEHMTAEEIRRYGRMRLEKYIIRKLGIGVRRSLTDAIQTEINPTSGIVYAKYTNMLYNIMFGMTAKDLKAKYNLKKNEPLRNILNESELEIISKGEDFMANLMSAGMVDYKMLDGMMTTWWKTMKKNQKEQNLL